MIDFRKLFYKDGKTGVSFYFRDSWLKKNNFYNYIYETTSFLDSSYSNRERIFCIANNIASQPICKCCGKRTYLSTEGILKFREFCSVQCSAKMRPQEAYDKRDLSQANEKRRKTLKEKFGYEYNSQRPEIKKKISDKMKLQLNSFARSKLEDVEWLINEYVTRNNTAVGIGNILGCDYTTVISYCRKANLEIKSHFNQSSGEIEVADFMDSILSFKVKRGDRQFLENKKEIDILIPEHNLAIEYEGLFWHSEAIETYDREASYKKYTICKEKGFQLITIFEDEWIGRQEQVKSYLSAKVGIFQKRDYARNCIVKEIEKEEAINFINQYHIQKVRFVKKAFGLFLNDELVGVVSYATHHRKSEQLVLNRIVFKAGIQIVGGMNKLIQNTITKLDSDIITWSDNRWSTGEIYEKCGFVFDGDLPSDYSYSTKYERFPKQAFMKKNTKCPENMTEHQWALQNGYYRMYDCGKKRWKYISALPISNLLI